MIIAGEHYDPILGGTTHLLKKNVEALSRYCNHITVLVPSPSIDNSIEDVNNVRMIKIGIGSDYRVDLTRAQRMLYINKLNEMLPSLMVEKKWDVFHVLTGIYLLRHLEHDLVRVHVRKMIATIINVPPQECGSSWKGDNVFYRIKDALRKIGIRYVNKKRIKYYKWDEYVSISECGKKLLSQYIPSDKIKVIYLGCDPIGYNPKLNRLNGEKLQLLTIGGYVAHKNQHILATVAERLQEANIPFLWLMVGPVRDKRYYQYLLKQLEEKGVSDNFRVLQGLSHEKLKELYIGCDIYVQPSLEEGFCMTALDAVLLGRPLIGIAENSGAIADFVRLGKGMMCSNDAESLFEAINIVSTDRERYKYSMEDILQIEQTFAWENVASKYYDLYI